MSAETPETDALWSDTLHWCHAHDEYHDPYHAQLANLAAKLERERNEARKWAESYQRASHYWQERVGQKTDMNPLPWPAPQDHEKEN